MNCYIISFLIKSDFVHTNNIMQRAEHHNHRPTTAKRLARIQFKQSTKKQTLHEFNKKYHKQLLEKDWRFNFEEYEEKQISKLLVEAAKMLINGFSLHFCKNSFILRDIRQIYFPQLTYLYLPNNSISNLQGLVCADMPHLKNLDLRQNNIVSLRALRRARFKLVKLELTENKILFLDDLWLNLNLKELKELWVDKMPTCVINYSFAKSQSNFRKMKKIQIGSKFTIRSKQPLVFQKMRADFLLIFQWVSW